jgi:ribosomal protein S18 acetylase RimI-like enzyme
VKLVGESFSFEKDLDRIRRFLLKIYNKTDSLHYLIPTKIENQKFGPCGPAYSSKDDEAFRIWTCDSETVAISHRGSSANYHIEVHPDYKHMERDLFQEIERLEKGIVGEKRARMYMYTVESDSKRPKVLTKMGYEDYGLHEYNYMFPQDAEIPSNPMPDGYTVRGLRGKEDYSDFVEVIGSVYDHCRQYMTIEKMRFMTKAEFFHQDLNLIVTDEAGRFVGFCMCRLDPLTGIAEMEAVDVRPECGGLGLEASLLSEALRRVMKYRPNLVCAVEVDISESMNQMLESAGFVRTVTMNMWGKMIDSESP